MRVGSNSVCQVLLWNRLNIDGIHVLAFPRGKFMNPFRRNKGPLEIASQPTLGTGYIGLGNAGWTGGKPLTGLMTVCSSPEALVDELLTKI